MYQLISFLNIVWRWVAEIWKLEAPNVVGTLRLLWLDRWKAEVRSPWWWGYTCKNFDAQVRECKRY